ncbi:MAG: DegT/DnrJ/EryC1/StrS family aminotransferase [Gemmatimonadales bacterium]
MIPRVIPPVYSPVPAGAVLRAWTALLSAGRGTLAGASALVRERYGAREVLLTDSGTSALALAMRLAVTARPGRPRIAIPAWACYDIATAADTADVEVVLYDLDPETLGPEPASFDAALQRDVAAAVVIHPFALPLALPGLLDRVHAAGALLIEDAAQAIGATVHGRPAGALGDLGVLSFGRGKGWTGGGGGALLLNQGAPAELTLPRAESIGGGPGAPGVAVKLTAQWLLARPALYAIPAGLPFLRLGETIYHPPHPPGNAIPLEAAVLLRTFAAQEREVATRRRNAERLSSALLAAGAGTVPRPWSGGEPGWLRLPFLPTDRTLLRADQPEARRLGIMPGYPIPLARLPGFISRIKGGGEYPGAELLSARHRTLPTHSLLREPDLRQIEHWLAS